MIQGNPFHKITNSFSSFFRKNPAIQRFSVFSLTGLLTKSIAFFLLPILTHHLTPSDYGILSIFNALLRTLIVMISAGTLHILLTKIQTPTLYPAYLNAFLFNAFRNTLIFTIAALVCSQLFGDLFGIPANFYLFIPGLALCVLLFESTLSILTVTKKTTKYAQLSLGKFTIEIVLTIILVAGYSLGWIGRVSALVCAILVAIPFCFRFIRNGSIKISKKKSKVHKYLFVLGLPLVILDLSMLILNLSDRFFIESMVGKAETGIYSVGYMIGGLINILSLIGLNVIRPDIYSLLAKGTSGLSKVARLGALFLSLLLLGAFCLTLLAPYIFNLMIDSAFNEGEKIVWIISFAFFFWGVHCLVSTILIFFKFNKLVSILSLGSIALNIILNYVLVISYGWVGAAYSTLVTFSFLAIIELLLCGIHIKKTKKYEKALS